MTSLLLKILNKRITETNSAKYRTAAGKLAGVVGIVCNLLLFAAKLVIGILSGSVSITADALNNLSDASGAIVTLVCFKLSEKPADPEHPYGHARFEYLSGLAVAVLIILIGFELAKSSIGKIIEPTSVGMSVPLVAVLVISIIIKLWLSRFLAKLGKSIDSASLQASSADSRNDVIATLAVLLAVVAEHFTSFRIDGYIGLCVALFIFYSGIKAVKETISPLLGEGASPELKRVIANTVCSHPKVLGYHDLMVHDYGPGQRFASIHVEMDRDEDPMTCHEIIDDLERECLQQHNVHLIIHYDPIVTGDEELDHTRQHICSILSNLDSRISIHDFRMVKGKGHTNLIFDVVLPFGTKYTPSDVKKHIDKSLADFDGNKYYAVVTFDVSDGEDE